MVAIIGAGVSGLVLAQTLRRHNIAFVVFEQNSDIGGVWRSCTHRQGVQGENRTVHFVGLYGNPCNASAESKTNSGFGLCGLDCSALLAVCAARVPVAAASDSYCAPKWTGVSRVRPDLP